MAAKTSSGEGTYRLSRPFSARKYPSGRKEKGRESRYVPSALAVAVVAVDPEHHPVREGIRLALGVGPEDVMAELVIDGVDPAPLRVVLPAALPVLRVHEMDDSVLVRPAAALPPV